MAPRVSRERLMKNATSRESGSHAVMLGLVSAIIPHFVSRTFDPIEITPPMMWLFLVKSYPHIRLVIPADIRRRLPCVPQSLVCSPSKHLEAAVFILPDD